MIQYGKQLLSEADKQAVLSVLESDFLTQGPQIIQFEAELAQKVGAKFSVAVNSATSALHIACMALDLQPGDSLWTSPNTFVASANVAVWQGAKVDFVDIDPRTYNMSVEALEAKLEQAAKTHSLPKIVMPVHFAGQSCDMQAIYELSKKYHFKIIEDASHAIGAGYQDKMVGACEFSDITVFSFHPVKIITTAEGGVATSNNPDLVKKMQLFRSHGVTRDESLMDYDMETLSPDGGMWVYQQVALGLNYRMTEMQAALGLSQLTQLETFVDKRHQLAEVYNQALAELPLTLPYQQDFQRSSYHLYPIKLAEHLNRKTVFDKLREKGIGVNVHYIPVHTQPYYQKLGFKIGDFPNAEAYYQKAISIPLHPGLTEEDQQNVITNIKESLI